MAIPIEQCRGQLQQLQQSLLQEPDYSGIGYGFSIAGHVVIALLSSHRTFVTMANAAHPPREERSYADDLGENESGVFLISGVDTISENPK